MVATRRWTNPSARLLAADGDPEEVVVRKARDLVYAATEAGWSGPPYDPFSLAELRGIEVVPSQAVVDATIVARQGGGLRIEYNPDQPRARQRYSVAHELAHALFPDVAKQARFRQSGKARAGDDWQLELLCNLGAAELLMPVGSLHDVPTADVSIDQVLNLRRQFEVSVEAIALRLVRLSQRQLLVFAAAPSGSALNYRVDYAVPSSTWADTRVPRQMSKSVIRECTAVGFTAKGEELFGDVQARVEAVGIPAYPGDRLPRVVGVVRPLSDTTPAGPAIEYLQGDATEPRGEGPRIVVQVVNDKTPNWGGGFALEVRKRWPNVQADFQEWAASHTTKLNLGTVRFVEASPNVWVASVVAMHGYGASAAPRIRYHALERGLAEVRDRAVELRASVHAPRIGAGQARGSWPVISGLIDELIGSANVAVSIYDLPGSMPPGSAIEPQLSLDFGRPVSVR